VPHLGLLEEIADGQSCLAGTDHHHLRRNVHAPTSTPCSVVAWQAILSTLQLSATGLPNAVTGLNTVCVKAGSDQGSSLQTRVATRTLPSPDSTHLDAHAPLLYYRSSIIIHR
jgi:hypothetical protein